MKVNKRLSELIPHKEPNLKRDPKLVIPLKTNHRLETHNDFGSDPTPHIQSSEVPFTVSSSPHAHSHTYGELAHDTSSSF